MEATAVSLARSVLDGVLKSAGTAVADEVARLAGVPKEVEFIRNELEMMRSFLKVASAHPEAAVRNDTVRTWVKQVRDLAYDVEDCLLDFALYADRASSSRAGYWLAPGAVAARRRIAARIRDLKARVEELNQRNLRYHVVVGSPAAPRGGEEQPPVLPDHDAQSAELAFQASADVVGRGREKAQLTELISGSNGAVVVVSVWGMGGMGKSSLVRMVHNDPVLLDEFDCGAWITVPHPLDGAEVFRRRLRKELGLARDQSVPEYLQEKRYLVIVDDLHSQEEWENICQVFHHQLENRKGSRIIVTTRREDVARHCAGHVAGWDGHVYELKPLRDGESMDLLCQKVYKTTDYVCPTDMEDQARRILRRCHGLPLAISTIGGLLANRPKTSIEWRNLHEHLGAELESDLRNIRKVIVSSYDGLPYHLKSIFLYLSIFPENHEIRRTRLLRRWMAEGHIAKNRDMPVEDVGERFYSELINRSMIQPSKANPGVRADRCRVHSILLQIILSKSIEENQLLLIEKQSNGVPQSKIRHLVVSRWKRKDEKLQNINPSYIRSLTIFGECPASLISPKMRLLRVLDLEDTSNLKNDDLAHIGELHHLRYLCLRGTDISKLPYSLQNLRYLETLDIEDTHVRELPSGVAKLEKLHYLLSGVSFTKDLLQKMGESGKVSYKTSLSGNIGACLCCNRSECCKVFNVDQFSVRVPEGIEKLKNLHMLGLINVGRGNGVAGRLKNLTNLTNLRRLGVTGLSEKEGQELCESIGELKRLQRLEVRSDSLKFLTRMDQEAPNPPRMLRRLVSLRLCGDLSNMPKWISSLNDLAKVKLLGTRLKQGDIEHLQNLRNLALLGLWENSYMDKLLHFCSGTFPKLKFLDIDGLKEIETVTIVKGAMPELEQLWVNKCPSLHDDSSGLSGVPHLLKLNELLLKNCGEKEKLINTLQGQVNRHIRRPKFLIGKSIAPTSPTKGTITTIEQ
ncbi:disease resistance protein RPM1-like [Panicum hallii]|uniref:disease resistance protein RPM1-like n=1 Tax=Panicum hallii TaxID=206008 RepID=UPI000DF4EC64|nr:disease resistance protein RPM1-like [Panicum hallii]